jgi:putative hemolysin
MGRLNKFEETWYMKCATAARTPSSLAQCVINLMNARNSTQFQHAIWFRELRKLLWPSSFNNNPQPQIDSSRSAQIYMPIQDVARQNLARKFRNQIHQLVKNKGPFNLKKKGLTIKKITPLVPFSETEEFLRRSTMFYAQ